MDESCSVEFFHLHDEVVKKRLRVRWFCAVELWGGVVIADVFHDEDVVVGGVGGGDAYFCFACFEQVPVFAVRPGEDDFAALAFQAAVSRVNFDVVVHPVKVAGAEPVDFDDAGLIFCFCGENVGFFADAERAAEAVDVALADEFEQVALGELVKDVFEGLERFFHGRVKGGRYYKRVGWAFPKDL